MKYITLNNMSRFLNKIKTWATATFAKSSHTHNFKLVRGTTITTTAANKINVTMDTTDYDNNGVWVVFKNGLILPNSKVLDAIGSGKNVQITFTESQPVGTEITIINFGNKV